MLKLRKAPASYDERFMDTMASEYLERTPWTELRLEAVRDLLDPQRGDRIVDLGCAAGAITHYLSTFGAEPVGVDLEPLAIARARELFQGLRFEVADATRLPFDDASFDKAVAADFVEHIEDETFVAMCDELRRVLVPGGLFAIYAPNPRHLIERMKERDFVLAQNPTHIGLRDADHMRRVLEQGGFEVVRSEWRPSFFRGLRSVEKVAGPKLELFRYRVCVLAQAR
ncbi:MAG TPA: class I SAM-dependent methyltransferase [Gaiellaceae bacterium]|nr:class I SAM-dependent methyltransferase [Gaiellaceae bacterium]